MHEHFAVDFNHPTARRSVAPWHESAFEDPERHHGG